MSSTAARPKIILHFKLNPVDFVRVSVCYKYERARVQVVKARCSDVRVQSNKCMEQFAGFCQFYKSAIQVNYTIQLYIHTIDYCNYMSACLSVCLSVCLSACLSACLSV